MNAADLYVDLEEIVARPEPFSAYTVQDLWTSPHTAEQMLQFHLNPDIDVSSRRIGFIDESVNWMIEQFDLSSGKRAIDFGCGPGLYASRLAAGGANVTGVDFSPLSIRYAREHAKNLDLNIIYEETNYLDYQPTGEFDLVCMIMCDFCALSPGQRSTMLNTFRRILSPSGRIVFDVYSMESFRHKQEVMVFEENLLNGFWSPSRYFGFLASFRYEEERVSLDKYTIVEPQDRREVFNWLQYFSPESLERELKDHELSIEAILGNVAGHPYKPESTEFAVVARRD